MVGRVDRFDGDVFEFFAGTSSGAGAEELFGFGKLLGRADDEEFVAGVEAFIGGGVGDEETLAVDRHDGAAEIFADREIADAAAGVFAGERNGDFVDLQIPLLRAFEDSAGKAGRRAERGGGFHARAKIDFDFAVEMNEAAPEDGSPNENGDGGDDEGPEGEAADGDEEEQPAEEDACEDAFEDGLGDFAKEFGTRGGLGGAFGDDHGEGFEVAPEDDDGREDECAESAPEEDVEAGGKFLAHVGVSEVVNGARRKNEGGEKE